MSDACVMIRLASGSVKTANLHPVKQRIRTGRGAGCDRKTHVRFWDQFMGANHPFQGVANSRMVSDHGLSPQQKGK